MLDLAVIHPERLGSKIDPVLRLVVGRAEGTHTRVDVDDERHRIWTNLWECTAWEEYRKARLAYDRVLGASIPPEYRTAAAQNAYVDGTNPTALHDWAEHQRRLGAARGLPRGPRTGFRRLDAALNGLPALTFLGGPTGTGKTTLTGHMAVSALRADPALAVLYYTLEMPKATIYDRLLCAEAGITYRELYAGDTDLAPPDRDRVMSALGQAGARLQGVLGRLRVVEALRFTGDAEPVALTKTLVRDVLDLRRAADATSVLVVIDSFQHLRVPAAGGPGGPLEQDGEKVNAIMSAHREARLAGDLAGPAFLVVSELRKPDQDGKGLSLDDLRGSGRLGYGASAVLILSKDKTADASDDPAGDVPLVLRIDKGRDGVFRTEVRLTFDHQRSVFREVGTGEVTASAPSMREDESPAAAPAQATTRRTGRKAPPR